ncbi:tetratricopeptide repeat protein [Streptomyces sp. SID625]|nr:tetratricopeptide repeat protein [Streptomyces sp. SID625]
MLLGELPRVPLELRARIVCEIGFFRIRQGRSAEALEHPRRALELYRVARNREGVASTLSNIGWVLAHTGAYEEAIATCEEALPLLRAVGDLQFQAGAGDAIGYAQQGLGDLDAAVAGYERSLRLREEQHDGHNRADALDHLASAQLKQGGSEQARPTGPWRRTSSTLCGCAAPPRCGARPRHCRCAAPGDRRRPPVIRNREARGGGAA